jgi:hypothetical protein
MSLLLKMLSVLLFVSVVVFSYHKLSHISLLQGFEKASIFSQFVSLKGSDKWIVAELTTTEQVHRANGKRLKYLDILVQSANLNEAFQANFNYYLKVSELEFSLVGDTVIFTVPDLYLVTPVAFDTATFNPVCHASLFSNCNKINAQLMSELSEELAAKGMEKMPSIYDAAAKSLADNFYHFVKDGKTGFKYKTIAVGFKKEGGPSRRLFSYD